MTSQHQSVTLGDCDPADRPAVSDAPNEGDRRRIRRARRQARVQHAEIEKARDAATLMAFRVEIGAVIRSASPLLISLLARDGLTLDDAVARLEPSELWPRRPRLSTRGCKRPSHGHLLRYYLQRVGPTQLSVPPLHSHRFDRTDGSYVILQAVDHSLELEASIPSIWLQTRFGELRVQFDEALPDTIATACVGRTIDEIVDHDAWRGRGWRIVAVEEPVASYFGQTLIVATGSVPHSITWPDAAGTELTSL